MTDSPKHSPKIGCRIFDLRGESWQVVTAWSGNLVLQRDSQERVITGKEIEQLFQVSPTSWRVVADADGVLVRRQVEALQDLRQQVYLNCDRADADYRSKYQDIVARPIYDDLRTRTLQLRAADELQRVREEQQEREHREHELECRARDERRAAIESNLLAALAESIEKANQLSLSVAEESLVDYPQLRSDYLKSWFADRFGTQQLSAEQLSAIGDLNRSLLLRARAGSGKTRVIANKAALIMSHERVQPDQLIILAFNRKAAKEATDRIGKELGIVEFNNARTFHSLAYQLVKPKADLLFDENTGSTRKQSQFVQDLLNSVLNPALVAQIYLFFREEVRELENIGAFMSEEDYYTYRRNHVQEALGGQSVKSTGEKWIADFLFEHGIRFAYEAVWYWDDGGEGTYRPDFSLVTSGKRYDIVIEHWGIDLDDPRERVPAYWDQTWAQYRHQIDRKRAYWKRFNLKNVDQRVLLIETSISDLREGREAFEQRFSAKLQEAGVTLQRLSEETLKEKVVKSRIGRFSTMCLQYIQKAKKQRLSPEEMADKIGSATHLDARTKTFVDVANNIYRRYQQELRTKSEIDYDDLMEAAIRLVHGSGGRCQIRIEGDRYVAMNELRWIMIDEYQDFSRLFYDLVDAIRAHNPPIKLFCVGDNWQAINAFAGSDLCYFDQFQEYIEDGEVADLKNNYRSAREIVSVGNHFMQGKGKKSIATREDLKGRIEVCAIDKVWIEQRPDKEYAQEREIDRRFETWVPSKSGKRKVDAGMRIGRMLKQCHSILTKSNYHAETTFAILSRVERLGTAYPDMNAFKRKLKSTLRLVERAKFGDFDNSVHCGTVHSYKGLESDVVIVLGVNKRNFPKIHPDNELHSIFGVTAEAVLAEEERLFYVAITRAKKDLYLFTESGRESDFLGRLGLTGGASRQASSRAGGPRAHPNFQSSDYIPF